MANEAKKIELYGFNNNGDIRRYTVADGNGITKGAILALSDPRTAATASTLNGALAGIAAFEKEASDGSTTIGAWTNGIFDLKASGAITVGAPVIKSSGANNLIEAGDASDKGSEVLGYALETAADAEVINVRVLL